MKTIIAGSRGIVDIKILEKAIINSRMDITEIVSGHCPDSPDILGEIWAEKNKIPIKLFPANWELFGRSAGPKRNEEMAKYADQAIILYDGKSRGTKNMIINMNHEKKPFFVEVIREPT